MFLMQNINHHLWRISKKYNKQHFIEFIKLIHNIKCDLLINYI